MQTVMKTVTDSDGSCIAIYRQFASSFPPVPTRHRLRFVIQGLETVFTVEQPLCKIAHVCQGVAYFMPSLLNLSYGFLLICQLATIGCSCTYLHLQT